MGFKPLPIGIDDFGDLISHGHYYVDKSMFIKELLEMKGKVNLFTRPRRFGKTLNMSMLQYFFEDTGDIRNNEANHSLFQGLKIMEAGKEYFNQMGAYPVISLSLKSGKQANFQYSYGCLKEVIAREFRRHDYVIGSLSPDDQIKYQKIAGRRADMQDYLTALEYLSYCLHLHHHKNVLILIDEYDVPLENAYYKGFYDEMIDFIRSLFESALKTNPYLEFAVITGCLRISKESIFTGLNNLEVISILNEYYGEHFGFVQGEVDQMLDFYGCSNAKGTVKKWYDGYQFGLAEVYNPWSVINYIKALYVNKEALPAPYWANTSSNSVIRDLIERANLSVKEELEDLLSGCCIEKQVHEEITYGDIYRSEDNLWNFLFFTGYLKQTGRRLEGIRQYISMKIPNSEVSYIYENTIMDWFQENILVRDLSAMYQAIKDGDAELFQKELSSLLMESISYMDSKELFYHGFLLGILGNMKNYLVKSNREAGLGRYDIAVYSRNVEEMPAILEIKVSDTFKDLDSACASALKQIEEKRYGDWLSKEGFKEVWHYGIAFYKKQCRVQCIKKQMRD